MRRRRYTCLLSWLLYGGTDGVDHGGWCIGALMGVGMVTSGLSKLETIGMSRMIP